MPPYMITTPLGLNNKEFPGLTFNPFAHKAGCRICGAVYQSHLDRQVYEEDQTIIGAPKYLRHQADEKRRLWCLSHSKTHSEDQHRQLLMSGEWCTPEAAVKLAPYGIFPLQGEGEVAQAMLEAPRVPTDDAQS